MPQEILSNQSLLLGAAFRHDADENTRKSTATLHVPPQGFVILIVLGDFSAGVGKYFRLAYLSFMGYIDM
jgi:hypothetical protein